MKGSHILLCIIHIHEPSSWDEVGAQISNKKVFSSNLSRLNIFYSAKYILQALLLYNRERKVSKLLDP